MASRPPPLPPPPPPPPQNLWRPALRNATPAPRPVYPNGSFGIGVETKFLLHPRKGQDDADTLREFAIKLAAAYNAFLSSTGKSNNHPAMHNAIDQAYHGLQFAEWSLDSDITIDTPNPGRAPWGVENISPIFRAYENSAWREHIGVLWEFLSTNYIVSANASCGTHVHLSRAGGYTLSDLKRVCQCIIHFEPAFEALLPMDRLSNHYARSNWLDNVNFGHRQLSRRQSIDAIEKAATIPDLVLLMNPDHDKMFGWNFLYLLHSPHGTIEFRRGAASTCPEDVFMWIEVAMSFVRASIQLETAEALRQKSPTVGGLKSFLRTAEFPGQIPGLYDSRYLSRFFSTASDDAFREPCPLGNLSSVQMRKLRMKMEEDKAKITIRSKITNEPYWV